MFVKKTAGRIGQRAAEKLLFNWFVFLLRKRDLVCP